jgi:hypothetical protein
MTRDLNRRRLVAHQRFIKQSVVLERVGSAPCHFPASLQRAVASDSPDTLYPTPHSRCRMSFKCKSDREQALRRIQIRRGISIGFVTLGPLLILAADAVAIVLAFIRLY